MELAHELLIRKYKLAIEKLPAPIQSFIKDFDLLKVQVNDPEEQRLLQKGSKHLMIRILKFLKAHADHISDYLKVNTVQTLIQKLHIELEEGKNFS